MFQAAVLEPEFSSPEKRRKVTKKKTTKKEKASAASKKQPKTTSKTEEPVIPEKKAPVKRGRRQLSENEAESKEPRPKKGKSKETETELVKDLPRTGKPSKETEKEPAILVESDEDLSNKAKTEESKTEPAIDVVVDSEDELPIKAKRGKNSQKKTNAALSKRKDEIQSNEDPPQKAKRGNPSEEPAKDEVESNDEVESKEELPKKSKRGKQSKKQTKAAALNTKDEDESNDDSAKKTKRGKQSEQKETKAVFLNTTDTKWDDIDFSCNKKNPKNKGYNLKVTSWNVDGLRAWLKKSGMKILDYDQPDIFCLQETKCSNEKLPKEVRDIPGYHDYWASSQKEGYAGVAVYTKILPENVVYGIGIEDFDSEGRCITLEFEGFYLVNVYVPNAGRGLVTLPKRLEWNEHFKSYIKNLDKSKPVIICGDMNVAHNEIDLANPKTNQKNAGFTIQERDGMTEFLKDGYVDSYRHLYPEVSNSYTFWSYMSKARAKNVGWRLDYFILSERIKDKLCDSVIRSQVFGSDHCPISLFISI